MSENLAVDEGDTGALRGAPGETTKEQLVEQEHTAEGGKRRKRRRTPKNIQ